MSMKTAPHGRGRRRRAVTTIACATLVTSVLTIPGGTASAGTSPGGAASDINPAISYTTVFSQDQDGYNSFRVPSIVQTNDGTLLAFAEGRVDSPSDNGNIDIVLKRSFDGGATWGPLQVVDDNGPGKAGNPVPIVDRRTGRIILNNTHTGPNETLQTIQCGQASAENTRRPFIQYSDDDGATWTVARDVTSEMKLPTWRHFVGGPGHGIQLQTGPYAGRLIIAGDHSITPPPGMACTDPRVFGGQDVYSDDGGQTWHVGGVSETDVVNPNESTATELPDGTVYFNTRAGGGMPFGRADTTSHDGGTTFDHEYQPVDDIIATQVGGSVITAAGQGPTRLVLSAPNHPTSRERMTLWSSTDNGASWQQGPLIYAGASSYSDLVQLGSGDRPIGVLYENGDRVPVDARVTYRQRITFARVPIGQLNRPPVKSPRTPDAGPGGHDAVVSGAPQQVTGRYGDGFELAGDYVEVPRTDALLFGSQPFSVAAWFKTSSTRAQSIVWADGTGDQGWSIHLLADQRLRATVGDGTTTRNLTAGGSYADGNWHHVVLTRSADAVTLYVDGVAAATAGPVTGSVSDGTVGGIRFGARLDGINDPLLGDLDEAWLFDSALTADQVQALEASNQAPQDGVALHLPLEKIDG